MDHSVQKTTPYRVISVLLLVVLAVLMIFPLYWIITGSFKDARTINSATPVWFPLNPTTDNYTRLFERPAGIWMFNTVFMCVMSMLLTCVAAAMGGYALAKKRFTGRVVLFSVFVCAMALPKQVILIPLLKEMAFLNLHNTLWAVIFPTVGWPFGVFLMKQFSENIPGEMLEAARIDGAGTWRIFASIAMPMVKPAALTLIIFTFQSLWNTTGGTFIYDEKIKLLPTILNQVVTAGIARAGSGAAASVVMMIPPFIIFIILQSRIIETMAFSGIKG